LLEYLQLSLDRDQSLRTRDRVTGGAAQPRDAMRTATEMSRCNFQERFISVAVLIASTGRYAAGAGQRSGIYSPQSRPLSTATAGITPKNR
jgi:hypothetical protein